MMSSYFLLSFWLPFRKSNFINMVEDKNSDNLIIRVQKFLSHDRIILQDRVVINLNSANYNTIFKYGKIDSAIIKKYILAENDINIEHDGINKNITICQNGLELIFRRRGLNSINYLKFKFKIDGNNNSFEFFIDEYGFYFIDIQAEDIALVERLDDIKNELSDLLFSFKSNKNSILTSDQWYIINGGLLFEYQKDSGGNINKNKVDDFFKISLEFINIKILKRIKEF